MSNNHQEQQTPSQPVAEAENHPVKPQITPKQAERIFAPTRNMIISMVVLIAILIPVLWLAPQLTNTKNFYQPNVDVHGNAYLASQAAGYPVAAPELDGWTYNFARWNGNQPDKVDYWNAGLVTKDQQYIELTQAKEANPTWVTSRVDNAAVVGTEDIAGVSWEVRSVTDKKEDKTTTSYIGEVNGSTVILKGETAPTSFDQLAQAVVDYTNNPTMTAEPTSTSGIQ